MQSRAVTLNGVNVVETRSVIPPDRAGQELDNEWAKSAFLISDTQINNVGDVKNRYWSSADAKFTDGRLGCNIGINAKPQFTRYTDIRAKGRSEKRNKVTVGGTDGNIGMGRYYSEAIDDPSQTIYMRFGVPQFSGLMSFLSRAYDSDMVTLARTGRASSLLYQTARGIGTITSVVAFPQIAAGVLLGKALNFMFARPTSKFYTLKPTMGTYWATVDSLVNNIAIIRGLLPRVMAEENKGDRLGQQYRIDPAQLAALNGLMPDVFSGTDNHFDIRMIVNRAQRVANQTFSEEYEKLNNATATDNEGYLQRATGIGAHTTYISNSKGEATAPAWLNKFFMVGNYKLADGASGVETDPQSLVKPADETNKPDTAKVKIEESGFKNFLELLDAEFRDGSQFAVFKVDHTGSVQESFSNSVQESDISNKINGISSNMRQARFTFSEGNVVGGAVGDLLQGVMGAAGDVVKGTLDGMTFGFSNILAGLGGAGYIDIPKHWQSSSAQLPRSNYTIQLISPYGNVVSQLQNIYIPLCMLLAGTLPLSTGKASYTSPYLCQLFDRGRCQVKLGMIESLSITRGTSNLAFTTKGNPLAIDVSFTIADLSSIMHMPVSTGGLFEIDTNIDPDNIMADYLAVLAGQDLYTQLYAIPRAKLRFATALTKASKIVSPGAWAAMVHDALPDLLVNAIEGANRGSALVDGAISN